MNKKEIYSTLIFVKNTLKLDKENFILDVFDIKEDTETNKHFYEYLKANKLINAEQDLEFRLLLKDKETLMEEYPLTDVFRIITKEFEPQEPRWENLGCLEEEEVYAVLAGFLENEENLLTSLLNNIEMELAQNGLSFDYLKTLVPLIEFPKLKEQDCSQILSPKNYDIIVNGIETMQELLDKNMSEEDINMFKCILNTMNKAIQGV